MLVNSLSNGSVDVINKLVDSIVSRSANDPVINLGSQIALESIFGVDNTPPNEGDPAPDLLKPLAEANILVPVQRRLMVSQLDNLQLRMILLKHVQKLIIDFRSPT